MNYLRPNIKRGNYTGEEEEIILRLHESLGNRYPLFYFNYNELLQFRKINKNKNPEKNGKKKKD